MLKNTDINQDSVASEEPTDLTNLVSFRLRLLTNMYTKASASAYERNFGLTLNEWRVIALLSAADSLSISRLAAQAQFDRGLTTRIIAALIERDLITKKANPVDGRGGIVSLSRQGKNLVNDVAPLAHERNQDLLACLTKQEKMLFERILDKLTHQARAILNDEKQTTQSRVLQ